MKGTNFRLPYLFASVGVLVVISAAWLGRDQFQPLGPGSFAPDFAINDLDGELVRLSDFEGKVVLVNVWATWCLPCRVEMPSLERLYQNMEGRDFEILAISVDAPLGSFDFRNNVGGNVRSFTDSLALSFPILHDPTGDLERTYQTTGVPESFVIGPDGVIYKKIIGATEWDSEAYEALIERLLGNT